MRDQLSLLERCGLGYMADNMTISYSNPSDATTDESSIQQLREILTQYPFTSHMSMSFIDAGRQKPFERNIVEAAATSCHRSAQNSLSGNKTIIVFYFHNKGSSKFTEEKDTEEYKEYQNIYLWRRYMEWFLLERPTLCMRAILNHGTMTCGVNLQKHPSMHYSGKSMNVLYSFFHMKHYV